MKNKKAQSGFALVGILIGATILMIVMAGVVKTVQSSMRMENSVRQLNDFDTIKANVKSVLINEIRCQGAFRSAGDPSKKAIYHAPTVNPSAGSGSSSSLPQATITTPGARGHVVPQTFPIDLSAIYLFQGPVVTQGDHYGNGMLIKNIALQEDPTSPVDQVTHNGAVLNRHLVSLKLRAESSNGMEQTLNPEPRFFILADATSNEIVGCDGESEVSSQQLCSSINGTWDGTKCHTMAEVKCTRGGYLTGITKEGTPICEGMPTGSKMGSLTCPTGQVLTGIQSNGEPSCMDVSASALNAMCPTGQMLTGIQNNNPVCVQVPMVATGTVAGYCEDPNGRLSTGGHNECYGTIAPALCIEPTGVSGGRCDCPAGFELKQMGLLSSGTFGGPNPRQINRYAYSCIKS
jgi:hypothetical protein